MLTLFTQSYIGEPCDSDGEFRLRGGPTQREGLLEICYEGSFRAFFLFGVDVLDATDVCDELGFLGGKHI